MLASGFRGKARKFGNVNDPKLVPAPSEDVDETSEALIDLPRGKGFGAAESAVVARKRPTSVILFAGTSECGKTTLLASIYLLFHKGPGAG